MGVNEGLDRVMRVGPWSNGNDALTRRDTRERALALCTCVQRTGYVSTQQGGSLPTSQEKSPH